jgi:hypothetical protein
MKRFNQLESWVQALGYPEAELRPASSDASFRGYFRFYDGDHAYIVMDAPPDKEDVGPFIHVAEMMDDLGLHVPKILARDLSQGFLLLTDLGADDYASKLSPETVEALYRDALTALLSLQLEGGKFSNELPPYDDALLRREMALFPEWFLGKHLRLETDSTQAKILNDVCDVLVQSALEQPKVFVHRDYHSRNLMVIDDNNPGILDFQDAVFGPITYDLVSLLRDCYISWPHQQVNDWVHGYLLRLQEKGSCVDIDEAKFKRWFDLMGVQRHLKAIGIFARLNHRDGKPGYLDDIPRTMNYVVEVCLAYEELRPFGLFLQDTVVPGMERQGMMLGRAGVR